MKSFKSQRNLWTFTGSCFLLAMILNLLDGRGFGLSGSIMTMAAVLSFIRAFNTHKKISIN
jgi:hypothetical protein